MFQELPEGFCYTSGYFTNAEAEKLLGSLWAGLNWEARSIVLFGKKVLQPRLISWCSDAGVSYQYSGISMHARPWHSSLVNVRNRLQDTHNVYFNSVLVNAYRDGRDSMGWHADNEWELGNSPTIASVSLGNERRFLIRPRSGGKSKSMDLESGSLLLMKGQSQKDWQHSVPKTRKPVGLRINLTFRQVLNSRED